MIHKVFFTLIIICSLLVSANTQAQDGYKIDVTIRGWKDTTLILGHYFNKKMLVNDTIMLDSKGNGSFIGEEKLPGGVYIIYMPNQKYYDFLVDDEQHFSMTTDTVNYVNNLVIKGNKQAKAFNNYQKFISSQQKQANKIQEKLKERGEQETDSAEIWKQQLQNLSKQVNEYWDDIIKHHENTFLSSFVTAMKEVEVPDFKDQNLPDSVVQWKRYSYFRDHYFDHFNMNDDRLLRTPFFANKLESFFTKTVFQMPDSVVKESVRVIEMADKNYDMKKFLIQYTFNLANESKLMGMDAAMVALAEKYYLSGKADWVDEEFIEKLQERVTKLKPNLIGNKAPDLKLISPNNQYYKLSDVYAPLTILVFWEPECGHCKKEIPKIKKEVWDKYADKGVKVFCVYTQHEKEPWTSFIEEHQLDEWIHVYDPYNQSNFRNLYDIYSTPVVYILDENKKIVAKRIAAEQIPGFIDHFLKLNK